MAIDGFALEALPEPGGDRPSDADLVRQLIDGSQDALAALYDRHASAVFAGAMRVSRTNTSGYCAPGTFRPLGPIIPPRRRK